MVHRFVKLKHPYTRSNKLNAKLSAYYKRKVLDGFPLNSFKMTEEEIKDYFSNFDIQCLCCGKLYKALGAHLKIHSITIEEYKKKYGLPKYKGLIGLGTKSVMQNNAINNNSLNIIERDAKEVLPLIDLIFSNKLLVQEACDTVSMSKSTFYTFINNNPELKTLYERKINTCQDYIFLARIKHLAQNKTFVNKINIMRQKGMSYKNIASTFNIDTMTVHNIINT